MRFRCETEIYLELVGSTDGVIGGLTGNSSISFVLQGLKRLMTICQKHFETDPSKCVEYNAL